MLKSERARHSSGPASFTFATVGKIEVAEDLQTCLYPPLNIPEPCLREKKRIVMNSILRYKKIIDETRSLHLGPNFLQSGFFRPPSFSAAHEQPMRKIGKRFIIEEIGQPSLGENTLSKTGEELETEDERLARGQPPVKMSTKEEEIADQMELGESDDEDSQVKSDSDVDDYTAIAGCDDDEMNFEESAGEMENDNQF